MGLFEKTLLTHLGYVKVHMYVFCILSFKHWLHKSISFYIKLLYFDQKLNTSEKLVIILIYQYKK